MGVSALEMRARSTFKVLVLLIIVMLLGATQTLGVSSDAEVDRLFDMILSDAPPRQIEDQIRSHSLDVNVAKAGQLWTPLMMAAHHGSLDTVNLLLHYSAEPNAEEADGFTALLFAAHGGHAAVVETLIEHGANVYHESLKGGTALSLATEHPTVQKLLEQRVGRMESLHGGGEFLELCRLVGRDGSGLVRVEEMVRRRGKHIINGERNRQGWSCLTFAASVGSEPLTEFLLHHNADPNHGEKDGWSPLMFATSSKCVVCVEMLIDAGAIIGGKEEFSRLVDLAESHGEIISTLAGAGLFQHLDGKRVTPGGGFIMDAGAIMTYVGSGANPNTPNSQGVTALMLLAQTGEFEAVRDLLADGANPNWQEADGWTALMFASHDAQMKTFQLLLDHPDSDLSIRNKHGDGALEISRALGRGEFAAMIEHKLSSAGARTITKNSVKRKTKRSINREELGGKDQRVEEEEGEEEDEEEDDEEEEMEPQHKSDPQKNGIFKFFGF